MYTKIDNLDLFFVRVIYDIRMRRMPPYMHTCNECANMGAFVRLEEMPVLM
jgi:hypothetical protein